MKVSASPFEAPVGTTRSGERAEIRSQREGRETSLHLVRSAAASRSVRAGLDSATKEALKQLADLVQNQSEQNSEESSDQSQNSSSGQQEKRREKDEHPRDPLEPSALQAEPKTVAAVTRLRDRFESARQQRGRELYRQVLRDQAMAQIEDQFRENLHARQAAGGGGLDDALDRLLSIGAEFLDGDGDAGGSAASDVSKEATLSSRVSLKRVA